VAGNQRATVPVIARMGLPARGRAKVPLAALLCLAFLRASAVASTQPSSPTYEIERIRIQGNVKTRDELIRRELAVRPGFRLSVDDPRFELSRYRLLSLGLFSSVRLRLERGRRRGSVVLVVDLVERGTIVLTDLFFGTSEATTAWGGLGVAERNLLGRGISLEGAFVLGADPDVERGELQQSYWLRLSAPRIGGKNLDLSASLLFVDGSEFFRRSGSSGDSDPSGFLSATYRRIGGSLGLGFVTGRHTRAQVDLRGEAIAADIPWATVRTLPDGRRKPIDFDTLSGNSALTVVSFTVERDTRTDPFLPDGGSLLTFVGDASTRLLGSSYSFVKLAASYRHFFQLPWRHVLSFELFGGVLFGEAPFFEKFFIGDYNDLVPSRALGLNFSTLPSRDLLGTSIEDKRYEEFAFRTSVEYSIPWFRGGQNFYAGDFFLNFGAILLASKEDLTRRDTGLGEAIPVDLTLDAGLRLDTRIGIFRLSIGNALGRIPF
jgi:outer membrane protein insertion porin family